MGRTRTRPFAVTAKSFRILVQPGRSTVGLQPLELRIGVRIPAGLPGLPPRCFCSRRIVFGHFFAGLSFLAQSSSSNGNRLWTARLGRVLNLAERWMGRSERSAFQLDTLPG
jgi:hypothetical protein